MLFQHQIYTKHIGKNTGFQPLTNTNDSEMNNDIIFSESHLDMYNIKAKLSVHTEFGTSQLFYRTITMFQPSWAIIK
jgi:hypothetical protein